ncbi:MAG: response regulator [Verrucomicrobia bacterium]|nr:response regulator [Verrucomicrobiota bacterium]
MNQASSLVVVDDDPGFLRLMGKVLKREGYHVRFAEQGLEALKLVQQFKPDLFLMDLNLPDIDGETLAQQCRAQTEPVPFIVMTGHGDERVAVRMMKNGALDYVVKDAEFIELIPIVVSQAIDRIRQDRALRHAENQLEETAMRLEKAQMIAGMGSFEVCPVSHYCQHGSSSLEHLIGFCWQENKMRWNDLFTACVHDVDRARVLEAFADFIQTGQEINIEFRVRKKSRGPEFIQLTGQTLNLRSAGNQPLKYLVICRDITEIKNLQQEILHISTEERQRVGQDIHDGLCQHLTGTEVLVGALESMGVIQDNPKVLSIVREIRDLARAGTQLSRDLAQGLVSYEVDCESWQESIHNLAQALGDSGQILVHLTIEPDLPITSHPVANALFRITQEAVNNARKHARASSIAIRIYAKTHWLGLEISDNGQGFEPKSRSRKKGLGLHLMNYQAEVVGGHLDVHSSPQHGTQISARFPITHHPEIPFPK